MTSAVPPIEVVDLDEDGDYDVLAQPESADDDSELPFGKELLLLESDGGSLGAPRPFIELSESIIDIAFGTDADGTRWLALSTTSFE